MAQPPVGRASLSFVDAFYEQVREDGHIRDLAVLTAVDVNLKWKRQILGVSVALSPYTPYLFSR